MPLSNYYLVSSMHPPLKEHLETIGDGIHFLGEERGRNYFLMPASQFYHLMDNLPDEVLSMTAHPISQDHTRKDLPEGLRSKFDECVHGIEEKFRESARAISAAVV